MNIVKKLPIDYRCLIMTPQLQEQLGHEFGKDINKLVKSTHKYSKDHGFHAFINEKIKKLKFPKYTTTDNGYEWQIKKYGEKFATEEFLWERQSVIEFPISYDDSNDREAFDNKRTSFLQRMKKMGHPVKPEYEREISFGPIEYGWINEFLAFMHDKYKPYYINGVLPIFENYREDCFWIPNNPQNPRYKKEIDYPYPKAYFLSDIEKYIEADYELDMSELYDWILECDFIEGRYWERYYEWRPEFKSFRKTVCTKEIGNALHLMMIDLQMEKGDDGKYIPLFIDYYKKVKESYER